MSEIRRPTEASTHAASDPWSQAMAYGRDAWQRSVLYWDVMRQRGNQYLEHMGQTAPNVLSMPYETIMDGRQLPDPVNYGLLRIIAPDDAPVDPLKRPFLVVDPRAGHGPGIGGFKPESEIGVAVRAGHPCYFATFLPEPMPTQTVEDVIRAETRFLEEIIARHPKAEGKPVVVGNCQAGWQIMMAAAIRPELFGPIVIAGAPLSYWAGWRGMNPMRYRGGMVGGSWLTALCSDLGAGRFDGAWLVQNFENLNPANTLWGKQYNLYANVDTEAERYLSFEKWWGGHVFLNQPEIQYIVDNLFVGNRLSTGGLVTRDGVRIDLRNIRSPIIVFCSKGDNITPPPQALGWIPDLYENDAQLRAHGQTIVYAVHESIGHLGIFVSGSVARKEHQEFTSNIDMIDVLPPGLYQAEIADKTPETLNPDLADGDYVMSFARRHLEDIRAIVQQKPEDDLRFASVARISDINLGLYRSFVQPWVRAVVTPEAANWLQRMHPLRLPYELLSDRNPLFAQVASLAEDVRAHRQSVTPDNMFAVAEQAVAQWVDKALDDYRVARDDAQEAAFMQIYGSPLVRDWAGLGARPGPPRPHPGVSPEHRAFMAERRETLSKLTDQGGLREAAIRMLLAVVGAEGDADERSFAVIRNMRAKKDHMLALQTFKDIVRDQALIMMLDTQAAIDAIPTLLDGATAGDIRRALHDMEQVLDAAAPYSEKGEAALNDMTQLFEQAAARAETRERRAGASNATAGRARSRQASASPGSTRVDTTPGLAAKPAEAHKSSRQSELPHPIEATAETNRSDSAPTKRVRRRTPAAKTVGVAVAATERAKPAETVPSASAKAATRKPAKTAARASSSGTASGKAGTKPRRSAPAKKSRTA